MENTEKQQLSSQGLSRFFNIGEEAIKILFKNHLNLSHLYYLEKISLGYYDCPSGNIDCLIYKQGLFRKGYIDKDNNITDLGKSLLDSIKIGKDKVKIVRGKKKEEKAEKELTDFDRWWAIFPPTDKFDFDGKSYPETRGLRISKEACKKKFKERVEMGYTADEIIKATQVHLQVVKRNGAKKKENTLTYVHNSLTYLNQEDYGPFIGRELGVEDTNNNNKPNNVVDI